tara:strand:- start:319 stop:444 length:126 start_codon:yes stop_codon:yes gene_type:complete
MYSPNFLPEKIMLITINTVIIVEIGGINIISLSERKFIKIN